MSDILRLYSADECGADGYPLLWHRGLGWDLNLGIKHMVRDQAEHRCVRCLHPYEKATASKRGEWSPCDERCTHRGEYRYRHGPGDEWFSQPDDEDWIGEAGLGFEVGVEVEARWRILTVHHLDNVKGNCRWWNLVALCQRCHLQIQGKVRMERVWPWEHSGWFKPYVAGYYAQTYLGEDLGREAVVARLDELLGLELAA